MEWYTKAGGSSNDYFFIKDQSDDPYYSGTQRYNLAGETVSKWLGDDGQFTHYQNGEKDGSITDWYSPDPPNVTTTAINLSLVRALYSNSGDIGGNCNNYAPVRSGNSGQNSSGQNGDNRLSKLPATAGMTADAMSAMSATIKAATTITETALSHALTRPTTLIGAALSGGPAIINMWNHGVNTNDLVTVGISAVAIGLEFSPEGVAINIASAAVSLGSVAWDAYTLTHQENR